MDITWLIFVVLLVIAAAGTGYELGRDNGLVEGRQETYEAWARRIELNGVELEYLEEIVGPEAPNQVDLPKRKKKKWKKKHRKKNESKYDRAVWFFGDLCKVPKPFIWNKCNKNKFIKELERELRERGELDE